MLNDKVVLVTLEFPPDKGGVARMYGQVTQCMEDRIEVIVDRPNEAVRNPNVHYRELVNKEKFWKWWPAVKEIYALWKTKKYKKVIIGQVLPLGSAAFLVSLFTNLKYDVFFHGMDFTFTQSHFRKRVLTKLILRRAQRIIAANNFMAELIIKSGVDRDKIVVIHPAPGIIIQPENSLIKQLADSYKLLDKPVLLTVARLVERKGIQHVLKALEIVWQKNPEVNYIILGDGPYKKELEVLTKKSTYPRNVHFLSNQNDKELSAWYQIATLFIMTPYTLASGDYEGFGVVYLEASIHSKPCIATRSGGVPEAVVDGKTGLLVEEKNIKEIAVAITRLIENPDLAKTYGDNGARYVIDNFSQSIMRKKLNSLYD
jgi:phosphatidylinositol alpha-1,6-mannosyltransferase